MLTTLVIDTDLSTADMNSKLDPTCGCIHKFGNNVINQVAALVGGRLAGKIQVSVGDVKATGTVTLATVLAADTVTVDGIVFTAVNGGATGNQFNMNGTDSADADSLVSAINANTTLDGRVIATNSNGVVTITALDAGELGNSVSLASSNGTRLAVSGAALAGGVNGTKYTFRYGKA